MTIQPPGNLYTQGFGSRPENVEVPHVDVRDPSSTDTNYPIGKRWINTIDSTEWSLNGLTSFNGTTTANWQQSSGSGSSGIVTINGNSGSITGSTVTINGGSTGLTTSGSGSTMSLGGTLNVGHGGTGDTTFTAFSVIAGGTTPTGALQNVSGVGTSGQVLTSNGAAMLPTWQAAASSITIAGDTGSDTGSSFTISGGSTGLTTAVSGSTLDLGGTLDVANGGTGDATFTAFSVITGGTTATGPLQNVSGVGTSGQVLTSNGAAMLPTWQNASGGGIVTLDGNSGSATGSTVTVETAASSGSLNFSGAAATLTLNIVDGSGNVALGSGAAGASTNGVAIGTSAANGGANGVVIGHSATDNTSGNNVVIGNSASGPATGGNNVVIGPSASSASTSSVCIGQSAAVTGSGSTVCIGPGASCASVSSVSIGQVAAITGAGNTVAIGAGAVASSTQTVIVGGTSADNGGAKSTILGVGAVGPSGGGCISLGFSAGSANTTGSDNITIGNVGVAAEANVIRIGTQGSGAGQQNTCFVAGIAGVTVANSAAVLIDTTTGQLGTVASSLRYKENVMPLAEDSEDIYGLNPVKFNYKSDKTKTEQYGLIAEEVEKQCPYLVSYNAEGEPETVQYHQLPVMLLNEVKKLRSEIEYLKNKLSK